MEPSLSPRQLAQALGVSESSVKRWVDAGELSALRTAGGHRRIPLGDALRYIRRTHAAIRKPLLLGLPPATALPPAELSGQLREFLLQGEENVATGLLLRSFVEGASLGDLIDGPLAGAMREIGEKWRQSSQGIFLEHRASEICLRALYRLEALLPEPPPGLVAVGGAPAGDVHLLPSLSVAICLRADRVRSVNLGANVPASSFVDAMRAHQAALVWISVTAEPLREVEQLLETVCAEAMALGSAVILGGRAHARLRNLASLRVERGSSMRELSAFARGLAAARRGRDQVDFTPH